MLRAYACSPREASPRAAERGTVALMALPSGLAGLMLDLDGVLYVEEDPVPARSRLSGASAIEAWSCAS